VTDDYPALMVAVMVTMALANVDTARPDVELDSIGARNSSFCHQHRCRDYQDSWLHAISPVCDQGKRIVRLICSVNLYQISLIQRAAIAAARKPAYVGVPF
jgi:hypothetical protein